MKPWQGEGLIQYSENTTRKPKVPTDDYAFITIIGLLILTSVSCIIMLSILNFHFSCLGNGRLHSDLYVH